MTGTTRIQPAPITGVFGALVKRFSTRLLGEVPEPIGITSTTARVPVPTHLSRTHAGIVEMPGSVGALCEPQIMTTAMTSSTASRADLLMLSAVLATCADCASERVFVPVEETDPDGEFCCTTCDAAVFLLPTTPHVLRRRTRAA